MQCYWPFPLLHCTLLLLLPGVLSALHDLQRSEELKKKTLDSKKGEKVREKRERERRERKRRERERREREREEREER